MTIPKFRAWLKDEYRMTDVREITFFDDEVQMISDVTDFYTYGEFELMQSTGLIDKNGKEIFEGDVLKTYDGELAKVVWNKELACWEAEFLGEIVDLSEVADVKSSRSDCEIVGNIYENPELVEEE
ncbi:YopX family protein [Streptococcus gallolyticus subsp. gallolyticus]|uniref:YopX family protein n=1 Tax=Streptococcus gallolyticus TaxID=315405 RepID=UPI002284108A|nr:YopX family protein [Streptococcus gallolyticus]MCY7152224.1 YopX family protein [Streptococcus gallolyticus subsp. gallolyticus]